MKTVSRFASTFAVILPIAFGVCAVGCASAADEPEGESETAEAALSAGVKTFRLRDLADPTTPATPIYIDGLGSTLVLNGANRFRLYNDGFHSHRVTLEHVGLTGVVTLEKDVVLKVGRATSFFVEVNQVYDLRVSYVDAEGVTRQSGERFRVVDRDPGENHQPSVWEDDSCTANGGRWVVKNSGTFCERPGQGGEPLPGMG